jgi:glycosyltransferase involved in cell wall biosynthesis
MHILYDLAATQPSTGKYHGGGEYGKVVFQRLVALRDDERISAFYRPERWLDPSVKQCADAHANVRLLSYPENRDLTEVIRETAPDRFYTALPYGYYDVDFSDVELVMTIHGLRPIENPTDRYEYRFQRSLWGWVKFIGKQLIPSGYVKMHHRRMKKLLEVPARKKSIVVPSRHTKYALLDTFGAVEFDDVRVLYSPEQESESPASPTALEQRGIRPERYILMVSGGRWRKNAYRAVHALDDLFSRWPEIDLDVVVTGVDSPSLVFGALQNRDQFQFLDYVDRPILEALYREAYCLLYPTLNEGFGYPPLEAMRYETPVLCSAVTSLPEVCQDAALYFNPYAPSEIRNRVLMIERDKDIRQTYACRAGSRHEEISKQQDQMLTELCRLILGRTTS